MKKADIGLIGLAVMGENLVMNMESKGFTVAVFNRTTEKVDKFVTGRAAGKNIIGCHSLEELVDNLEKALETISKRLLEQIKDGETPSRELGELAKVMKQAVEIRQELQEEHGGQETGVRVVFEREAEEFSE